MTGDGIHSENMSQYKNTRQYPSDAWMDVYRRRFWDWRCGV